MFNLHALLQKSRSNPRYLWLLNLVVQHIVPFNKPHAIKIKTIGNNFVETTISYSKKNFNHVKGIHACAIATIGEFSAGLTLMCQFSPRAYRIILSRLEIDYLYQAKKPLIAKAILTEADNNNILQTLSSQEKTSQTLITEIIDTDQQKIAFVKSTWQIKDWKKVKTKV